MAEANHINMPAAREDAIMPLYWRWAWLRSLWRTLAAQGLDEEGAAMQALDDQETALFMQIVNMVPTTRAGIAAKLHLLWLIEHPECDPAAPIDQLPPSARLILTAVQGCGFDSFPAAA